MARPHTLSQTLPGFWRVVAYFMPRLRSHRLAATGCTAALCAGIGIRLLEPWPLKIIFDYILPSPKSQATTALLPGGMSQSALLLLAALAVIAITGLRALADYMATVGFAQIGHRVLADVRLDLFRQLQRLSLSFHHKSQSGDLIIRVIGDVNLLKDVVVTAVLPLMVNLFVLAGMAGLMLWLEWRLALISLLPLPLFWLAAIRISRRIQETGRKQRRREGRMAAAAAESIGGIKVVQALSLEHQFADAFAQSSKKSLSQEAAGSKLAARLERSVDLLGALATALVLWLGVQLVLNGRLTPGDLLVFLTYLRRAIHPLQDFAKYSARLAKATAAGERVIDLLQRTPDVQDRIGARPAPEFQGDIRLEQVSFAYEPGYNVLSHIDLHIPAGRTAALVGPSGIGKSTVGSLLLRLYDPDTGRLLIDSCDIRDLTLDSVRGQISVVLQDTLLFAASVRDNIAYGRPGATHEEIEHAARFAQAHTFISALPDGYDTIVGERGVTLSHGQRQRIAIARAAVRRSPILILDEATTGLDEANAKAVRRSLDALRCGRTTILITHDLTWAAQADQILYLAGGRVGERGSHAELLQAGGDYAAMYLRQTTAKESCFREGCRAVAL